MARKRTQLTHRSIPASALSNPVFRKQVVASRKKYSRKGKTQARFTDYHSTREWAV